MVFISDFCVGFASLPLFLCSFLFLPYLNLHIFQFTEFIREDPTRLLINLGANVNLADYKDRNTPLHWAIYSRNSNAVANLLRAGANVFVQNVHGDTPLEMARRLQISSLAKMIEDTALEHRLYTKPWNIRLTKDKVLTLSYTLSHLNFHSIIIVAKFLNPLLVHYCCI